MFYFWVLTVKFHIEWTASILSKLNGQKLYKVDGWDGISERKYLMQSGANRLKYFADQTIFKKIELIN